MKATFVLVHDIARQGAVQAVQSAPAGCVVLIREATRTLEQNAKLWPMLTDISKQVVWYGQYLTNDEWKDVFTAALVKAKVVPGLDGGFVVCGQRTSTMAKKLFSDLIEVIYAFGSERNVKWSEPSTKAFETLRRAA